MFFKKSVTTRTDYNGMIVRGRTCGVPSRIDKCCTKSALLKIILRPTNQYVVFVEVSDSTTSRGSLTRHILARELAYFAQRSFRNETTSTTRSQCRLVKVLASINPADFKVHYVWLCITENNKYIHRNIAVIIGQMFSSNFKIYQVPIMEGVDANSILCKHFRKI